MSIINIVLSLITKNISISFLKELLPLFNKSSQQLVANLLPKAVKIVSDLAENGELTNKQKQKEAVLQLIKISKKEGMDAGTSTINLIVELAVTKIKNN